MIGISAGSVPTFSVGQQVIVAFDGEGDRSISYNGDPRLKFIPDVCASFQCRGWETDARAGAGWMQGGCRVDAGWMQGGCRVDAE